MSMATRPRHAESRLVRIFAMLLAVWLTTGSVGAATQQPVTFEPHRLAAGQPFRIKLWTGPCEFLNPDPHSATIVSQVDGTVFVRVPGTPDITCNGDWERREYWLPGLPEGVYRVEVILYLIDFPGAFGQPYSHVGSGLAVIVGQVASIPTLGTPRLVALALGMMCLAAISLVAVDRRGR